MRGYLTDIAIAMRAAGLLAIVGCSCTTALADDTELFVTGFDAPAVCENPNVLFLIDTSLSMESTVLTQASWDPDTTFSGCFDSDTLYYSPTGDLPDCGSATAFAKPLNRCAASNEGLRLVGRYRNLFRSYDAERERWQTLDPLDNDGPVECEADRGIDGDGTSGLPFAADGPGGPWAADDSNEPAWGSASNVTIFDGNWLNWNASPPTVERTRLEVVQEVVNSVIDSLDNLNVGVMRFNRDEGGPVIKQIEDVLLSRQAAKDSINGLSGEGSTPLSETLFEAGQYYAQRLVDYGNVGPQLSVPLSRLNGDPAGTSYLSPIRTNGQKSFIVLLSDGEPKDDSSADEKITSLPEFPQLVGQECDGSGDGRCLDDMAEYLFKRDLRQDVPGLQNVVTHTIGFTLDLDLLRSTAERGGGRYFTTEDTASLAAALTDLAESFDEEGGLFAAPTVAVNSFNRTATLDDVYLSVFEPSETIRWLGNLKRYRLAVEATGDAEDPFDIFLEDQDGREAVDPATGFFIDETRSFWSDDPDGNDPRLGGAASQLPDPDNRRVYTNIAGGDLNSPGGENRVTVDNALITAAIVGSPDDERERVIEWARGKDVLDLDADGVTDEARGDMGDPLHSRPAVVVYGGTAENPDATVFVGSNDGYLHAIDASTGEELWAFIPERLLGRLFGLFTNNVSATRSYGLDGEITVFIENNDLQPGIGGDERVLLVFGMRRGGEAVFALDVTNRSRPRLLWEIDSGDAGLSDLGQTWSPPRVTNVLVNGQQRRVVLFAGGYDTGQDNRSFREDSVGNAIFMVDLADGELIWSAGNDNSHDLNLERMRFSIPGGLALLDVDEDGNTDRLYFGDMGGQLWRLDVRNGQSVSNLADGGVLASLGAADLGNSPPASEVRRFYNTPDVVPVLTNSKFFFAINIGSGYRAHPLDSDADEQFFSVRDFNPLAVLSADDFATPFTVDQLIDVTTNVNAVVDQFDAGWRLQLVRGAGEKSLSESVTFANTVFFTSFQPGNIDNTCGPSDGFNRVYQVDIRNGRPQTNLDNSIDDDELTETDRFITLRQGGIAPRPVFLFPEALPPGEGPIVLSGTERVTNDPTGSIVRSFWLQREQP
jgi:type IV pilus assembly protein PilY1